MVRKRKTIDNLDCRTVRGRLHVRVQWDDTSQGDSHYVPVSTLKCESTPLVPGAQVQMRHSKGKLWKGRLACSARYMAASSLVSGECKQPLLDFPPMLPVTTWLFDNTSQARSCPCYYNAHFETDWTAIPVTSTKDVPNVIYNLLPLENQKRGGTTVYSLRLLEKINV